jgi:DNA-binding NarL/FixJ family response regulator
MTSTRSQQAQSDIGSGASAESSGGQVSVLIADDHMIAREGLRSMLETSSLVKLVGEARDGREAIEMVARLKPNLVLMDYKMPGMDGLEATRRIKAEHPTVSVVMMTSYEDEAIVLDAVQAGAGGYLVKDSSRELLLHTVMAVASGGILVKASLLKRALQLDSEVSAKRESTRAQMQVPPIETLTTREESILRLLAEGKTNRAIADKLGFAEVTVKKHVQEIIAKLYASDRTHAAVIAMRLGVID